MKIYSLLHLFRVFHPDLHNVSGNSCVAETRAKSLNEAIEIFRAAFPVLNENGYYKKDEINSYCVAVEF